MQLIADNLTCERGGRIVYHGLNFVAEAGTAMVVVGPNGIGKSSLLRQICGLVELTGGTLQLDGGDPELTVPAQCHYFGHQDALKPALSVEENLRFWTQYYGPGGHDLEEALEIVGISPISHLPAGYLSAGQRRRLSLARLLVSHRPVWLLDEPTSALDQQAENRLVELMNNHLESGGLIIAATHAPLDIGSKTIVDMREAAQ